jgi:hypothetical protein
MERGSGASEQPLIPVAERRVFAGPGCTGAVAPCAWDCARGQAAPDTKRMIGASAARLSLCFVGSCRPYNSRHRTIFLRLDLPLARASRPLLGFATHMTLRNGC